MGVGGGRRSLSKLGIVLTVIFVVSLLALFVQLFYALWRRRRASGVKQGADHLSISSSSESTFSSKELLYFFCIRPPARLDSNSATVHNDDRSSNRRLDMEIINIDLLKLQGMFGPPRFLFTIKEEEREGFDSPADKSLHSADKEAKKNCDCNGNSRVSLEECFKAADAVVEIDGVGDDATLFSTPCASPVYFTPLASPAHSVANGSIAAEVQIDSEKKKAPLVRSEE